MTFQEEVERHQRRIERFNKLPHQIADRKLGLHPMAPDSNRRKYGAARPTLTPIDQLPQTVLYEVPDYNDPVDQGSLGDCWAVSFTTGPFTIQMIAVDGKTYPAPNGYSAAECVKIGKNIDGDPNESGSSAETGFIVGEQYGLVPDSEDPLAQLTQDYSLPMPSAQELADGASNKTGAWAEVLNSNDTARDANSLLAVLNALAYEGPQCFAIVVADNFMTIDGPDFTIPLPAGTIDGLHLIRCIGYDISSQMLKIINTWGKNWANEGKANMPFSWVMDQIDMTDEPDGSGKEYVLLESVTLTTPIPAPAPAPAPTPTPPTPDPSKQIVLQVGNAVMQAFGQSITMDVAPVLLDIGSGGRVMIPVRFVVQALGCTDDWVENGKYVYITPAVTPAVEAATEAELVAVKAELAQAQADLATATTLLAKVKSDLGF